MSDAMEKLAEIIEQDVYPDNAAEAIRADATAFVPVKTLKWNAGTMVSTDNDDLNNNTPHKLSTWTAGIYTIIRQKNKEGLFLLRGMQFGLATPTLEAAQAAAQTHFENQWKEGE